MSVWIKYTGNEYEHCINGAECIACKEFKEVMEVLSKKEPELLQKAFETVRRRVKK